MREIIHCSMHIMRRARVGVYGLRAPSSTCRPAGDRMQQEKKVITFPRRERDRDELAFLPAALEIVETPPSPVGRAIGATLMALFTVATIWATLGQVDIVATATGKIIPTGHSKVIQPFETGVVRAIRVADGETVKAGDQLIELDPTIAAGETAHLQGDLVAAQLDIA